MAEISNLAVEMNMFFSCKSRKSILMAEKHLRFNIYERQISAVVNYICSLQLKIGSCSKMFQLQVAIK